MFGKILQKNEGGFSLVEILVVVLIIGILAAIAIPMFLNQRQEAIKASMLSDMKSAAIAVEQFYAKGGKNTTLSVESAGQDILAWGGVGTEAQNVGVVKWNSVFPNNKVAVSDGTHISLRFHPTAVSSWKAIPEGEFCLVAGNVNTKDYRYPGGSPLLYPKLTYFDSQQGGIVPFKKIVDAYNANQPVSCSGFAKVYIDAGGV